jgi:hypothetical protein
MAVPVLNGKTQFLDAAGVSLALGTVTLYVPGTTTPKQTWQDQAKTILNTLPTINLDAGGYAMIYGSGAYRQIVKDSIGTTIWDQIAWANDPDDTIAAIEAEFAASSGAGKIGYSYSATYPDGTEGKKLQEWLSVKDFGAKGDGSATDTAAIAAAIAAAPANGTLYFPPGLYMATISVRRNNLTLFMPGVTIKTPASVDGITLELGNTALGNSAPPYTNVNVLGYPTLDGNYGATPPPSTDLTGQAFIATNVSKSRFELSAKNTHNACAVLAINADYNSVDIYTENGGNAVIDGGHYPNFDINSCHYITGSVRTSGGYYGVRVLDNCYGINLKTVSLNPSLTGFVYNSQSVNAAVVDRIDAQVFGGCADAGLLIGVDSGPAIIDIQVNGAGGYGIHQTGTVKGVIVRGSTSYCGSSGVLIEAAATGCIWTLTSRYDCRTGGAGAAYALDISGSDHIIDATVIDSTASFTGSIAGTVLTVTAVASGEIAFNTVIAGAGITAGTRILSPQPGQTGQGGAGTYTVSVSQTVASEAMTQAAQANGIAFRAGANRNQLRRKVFNTVTSLSDAGANNSYRLSGSATYDPPSLSTGTGATTTVTVPGAKLGMPAFAGFSTDVQGIVLSASVQSADVVAVRFYNETGGTVDLASGTLTAIVQAA